MPENSGQKVTRYCPECGKKVAAAEEQFNEPRICPSCRTRVYFLDYPKNRPAQLAEVASQIRKRDPKTDRFLAGLIVVGLVSLLLLCLVALVMGQMTMLFVVSCIFLLAGLTGMFIHLDAKSKAIAMTEGFDELHRCLQTHEQYHTRLTQQLHGLNKNFDSLVEEERTSLRQQHERLLQEAAEDRQKASEERAEYGGAAEAMCKRLLSEVEKSIKSKLTPNNFATQKERFMKTVAFCEKKGYPVRQETIDEFSDQLKRDYQEAVRKQAAKEEQARIKEKIREEQRAERELEREMKKIAAEEQAIEKAIEEALARTHDEHSTEVEELRRRLADAEARAERAKSMAQLTKAGNVYVISNIGSFGENVFKIGMTRRLEPLDRVKELGDASVPFPFDVHMMISCDNAPSLEGALHREFNSRRVNRINARKEFFSVTLDEIVEVVERSHGQVDYVAEPEALEYNESLQMSEEDFAFVSSQVDPESLPEN
ncbi:MAG: GIY-YIG nuclease family protein [Candidatus Paceibacterota bacterium]